jgi:hypothetical protein
MSEDRQSEKAADASEPLAQNSAQKDAARSTSKSYEELMHGFEEIKKIVDNQEKFDKRTNNDNSRDEILKNFDKIKKILDNQEAPDE